MMYTIITNDKLEEMLGRTFRDEYGREYDLIDFDHHEIHRDDTEWSVWENKQTHEMYAVPEIKSVYMHFNYTSDSDRKSFVDVVEAQGAAKAVWGVTGRTQNLMLTEKLKQSLPQYRFEINYNNYECTAYKE